jgi:folate-binding protein YgfZ
MTSDPPSPAGPATAPRANAGPIAFGWNAPAVAALAQVVGATPGEDPYGPALGFASAAPPSGALVAALPDLGLLTVDGAEAARFLHGQLTNDVEHLQPGVARWGGYCSPKGRLLATFRYWRDGDGIRLAVARPLAASVARRLAMYVLRAKARVTDASDAHATFGLVGRAAGDAAAAFAGAGAVDPDASASVDGVHLVGLPPAPVRDDGPAQPRWLLVVPAARAADAWSALSAAAAPVGTAEWRATEVRTAVARIVPGTYERFVPQMLNFESVGGVSFSKGCYPGQEVVARSQYLGKLKRRMVLVGGQGAEPAPGSDVHGPAGGEPVGLVVMAAPSGAGRFVALVETQVAAAEAGGLRAGAAELSLHPLPYALAAID